MKKEKGTLVGNWRIVCWKINAVGGRKLLKKFTDSQYLWNFRPDGTLHENITGEQTMKMEYSIHNENLLIIVRLEKDSGENPPSNVKEQYRLELLTGRYAILYDLEGVAVAPDDYTLRIEMEKI